MKLLAYFYITSFHFPSWSEDEPALPEGEDNKPGILLLDTAVCLEQEGEQGQELAVRVLS